MELSFSVRIILPKLYNRIRPPILIAFSFTFMQCAVSSSSTSAFLGRYIENIFECPMVLQIGMLPGTMVFVNAERNWQKLIFSKGFFPSLIILFARIGIFPITVMKVIALYRSRMKKRNESA